METDQLMRTRQRWQKANEDNVTYTVWWFINNVSTNIILLFSLAMDGTYTVLKISFATWLYAQGKETGPDIFHFVVFFDWMCSLDCDEMTPYFYLLITLFTKISKTNKLVQECIFKWKSLSLSHIIIWSKIAMVPNFIIPKPMVAWVQCSMFHMVSKIPMSCYNTA